MKSLVLLTTMFCAIWFTPQTPLVRQSKLGTPCPARETNISGNYKGSLSMGGKDRKDASLSIQDGQFVIKTEDGQEISGMLSVNTTCNYTAVALRIDESMANPEMSWSGRTLSLKAVKGSRFFKLATAVGEPLDFTFQCECKKCKDPETCDCCAGKTP